MNERVEFLRAMEIIMRGLNDEAIFEGWLIYGVPDGEITEDTTNDQLIWLVEDSASFAEKMAYFVTLMRRVKPYGGLYVDGVTSEF